MKAVIQGKIYDTEKSTEIGNYWNGCGTNDFNHLSEALYKTDKGAYFLAGEGGANTRYGRSVGQNTWTGDSKIIPLDNAEALQWAEIHLDGDIIESEFSEMLSEA